ncbi:MAG: ABC transporter permease [Chthoniobacterales bacterium]|nr:ABC transporter permease [Chthoniobacterales bacterium]
MKNISPSTSPLPATVTLKKQDQECVITLSGNWSLELPVPCWDKMKEQCQDTHTVHVVMEQLETWDTSLLLFLRHAKKWAITNKKILEIKALPTNLQQILQHQDRMISAPARSQQNNISFLFFLGAKVIEVVKHATEAVRFVGNCTLGFFRFITGKATFRPIDFFVEMQHCWENSAVIVGFISFLVGVILAFQSAIQLRQYGASILVADLVGLSVVREMGPMMAAIIVAGSTGAGFAAQLGNMNMDEEIDALETLGLSTIDFLVLPRFLAVTVMMPLLALWANVLGILGGLFISGTMLSISGSAYLTEMQSRLHFHDLASGIIKSFFFGILIAFAGCFRGIYCERTTAGVGKATSSAVVTGIMLIVMADAIFAVIYNALKF